MRAQLVFSILGKKRCQAVHMAIKNTHLKTRDNNSISAQLQNVKHKKQLLLLTLFGL